MSSPARPLAILLGAGPTSGAGLARQLLLPISKGGGDMAVALLARDLNKLEKLRDELRNDVPGCKVEAFATDTAPANLQNAFEKIKACELFQACMLRLSIFHIKHSSRQGILDIEPQAYEEALRVYNVGALAFAQESLKRFYDESPGGMTTLEESGGEKKGTIIFTGTLGALRTNINYASYGSTRSAARSLAQAIAKEHSQYGVHVVHAIVNGGIVDDGMDYEGGEGTEKEETNIGKKISAQAVGETYLWLARQKPTLWTHELDLRPALEKF